MSWQESFSISLWQELCAYYIIAMQWYQQGISISSNHGQAILVPVISRLIYLFLPLHGLAYIQVFQVLPQLSCPEIFPVFFSLPLIGILPISYLDVWLAISYIKRYFLQSLVDVL